MKVNVWMAIPEDDRNGLNQNRDDGTGGPVVQDFLNGQLDPVVVEGLYLTRTAGQTTQYLWSFILDDANGQINQQINDFRQVYPGCQVLGCWKSDGAMLGCELVLTEVPNPEYVGEPEIISNPAYQPDPELPDPDGREFIRNPAYVYPTIVERSQTGTPNYESPAFLIDFMPNAVLEDVNLLAGWQPRIFA